MNSPRSAFLAGLRDQVPGMVGAIPFGMIVGAAGTAAGIEPILTIAMSVLVFVGASQIVAIQLMAQGAPSALVILAVLLVNLRIVMYSAAVAPYFAHLPVRWKLPIAYLLTDHSFALTLARFRDNGDAPHKHWYYLGAGVNLWLGWQIALTTGVYAGALLPRSWPLDFTIPLVFLALVVPGLRTPSQRFAALAAGVVSAFTSSMPLKTGLILAAICGVGAGMLYERKAK